MSKYDKMLEVNHKQSVEKIQRAKLAIQEMIEEEDKVLRMIYEKDLRDDKGELFGFGTHMFRHVYGIRLTELHLDDWTIAKLLGHTSVKNVKFYRKMSLQIIADETREIRAEMSRMIRANLAGWGKEYEQI